MQAFVVELKNKPGELAKLAEAIGAKGINITGFTGAACGDTSSACLITNDEAATPPDPRLAVRPGREARGWPHRKPRRRDLAGFGAVAGPPER